ncbi:MAG TPA: undecaprenyl-diphosphate phosphatase [Tissierellaceae bacterium]|nr:undecaprenyl-diphosphate phosphatase [Tissierellaceae bacterium]
MNWIEAIVLGIFQGVAEFLPISSSGHLALLQHLFGITEGNLFFTEMLHFGTLISIIIVYFEDVKKIIIEFLSLVGNLLTGKKSGDLTDHQRLGLLILAGSVPTAIIGITFEDFFESLYTSLIPIGIALLFTGFLLWFAERKGSESKDIQKMTFIDSLIIGTFQGMAIIPGISRSGSTIVAGLLRGLKKPLTTEFSFLLALPATFGAFLLGIIKVIRGGNGVIVNMPLVVGVVLSTVVGIISLKALIKILNRNKLHYFSYYLWIVGAVTIISQLI